MRDFSPKSISLSLLIVVTITSFSFGQIAVSRDLVIAKATLHPDATADISKVSRVKLFVPKRSYRLGELTIFDVGLLVKAPQEYYVRMDLNFRIKITGEDGTRVGLSNIFSRSLPASSRVFKKVSHELASSSTKILIGCNNELIRELYGSLDRVESLSNLDSVFENAIFRTPIDSCIDIHEPSELTISVEVINDWVVLDDKEPMIKTLTGSVESNSVKIFVSK